MKGHHAQLESNAGDGERDPGREQREARSAERDFPDARKLHCAGIGIDERHAEKKERGGSGSQNQILDSGFERQLSVLQVRHHGVQGDAQDLESEKEGNKMTARHQDRTTQSREQEQEI